VRRTNENQKNRRNEGHDQPARYVLAEFPGTIHCYQNHILQEYMALDLEYGEGLDG